MLGENTIFASGAVLKRVSVLQVCTEGRLILEFTFDDLMRIKSWHMSVRTHKELVPRTVVGMQQDPTMLEQLSKNITRQGITNSTLNYLRVRMRFNCLPCETWRDEGSSVLRATICCSWYRPRSVTIPPYVCTMIYGKRTPHDLRRASFYLTLSLSRRSRPKFLSWQLRNL